MRAFTPRLARLLLIVVILVSALGTAHASSRAQSQSAGTQIVRTLVYRDLMPATTTEIIESFYAWAAPQISRDGSTAVYIIARRDGPAEAIRHHVYTMDIESQESTEVDTTIDATYTDLSDDGSVVLSMHQLAPGGPRHLRVAGRSGGAKTIIEENGVEMRNISISGNGETAFFVLGRDSNITGVEGTAPGGLWRIDSDGGNLEHLVGAEDIRRLIDAAPEDLIFFSGYELRIDSSADGGRVVFHAFNGTTGENFIFGYEGGDARVIDGPYADVLGLSLDADGSTVLAATVPFPWGSAPEEYVILGFGGGDRRVLVTRDVAGAVWAGKGMQLSEDGSLALLGAGAQLYDVESGEAIHLGLGCASLSGYELSSMTMAGSGDRFLYLAYDYHTPMPLSLLELDPDELPAGAPVITSPSIDPDTVERGSQDFSTVTAGIEASGTPGVCVLVLQGIYNHTPLGVGVGAYATLYDDGTTGDETAGDGIFTNDTLYAV